MARKYTQHLTPRLAVQLAAPHTWPASVMPVCLAISAAVALTGFLSVTMAIILLLICVLMQSSVNTFNDYFDYAKGTDTAEDNVEESDATLVYNDINPHSALGLAIGFLAVAFILGIYVVVCTGWIPLVIAVIGALAIFFYSGGKTPISYLPIGELVSGCVMGGLIPLACFYVLTGTFSWFALIWAIPTIIGVGLIMMTNNISDIEKDEEANRHTLPVVLGRSRTRTLYHALIWIWLLADIVNVIIWFTNGIIFCIFLLVASYPLLKAMFSNPLTPQMRITSISQICTLNIALGAFYCLSMVAGDAIRFLLI